jgi:hypothetical protein
MKSAALASAGAVAGLGGLLQFSRWAAAAGSNRFGAWSSGLGQPLAPWPLIPIHAVLLGDGRVLTYGTAGPDPAAPPLGPYPAHLGQQTGYFIYDVWDPRVGLGPNSHLTLRNSTNTDIFCSAQIVLPQSGNVFVAGGDNWNGTRTTNTGNNNSNIFSPGVDTLTRSTNSMNHSRWYATPTTLPDGRIYIQGGKGGEPNSIGGQDYPEIRELDGTFRLLTGANTSGQFELYPRNWVAPIAPNANAPNGLVFGYSDRSMYYMNPNGNGSITPAGVMPSDGPSGWNSTEVMYAPGKILRTGGGSTDVPETGGSKTRGKNAAAVIDINGATVNYKKMPSMPVSLHWANATVLADGNVVVTGGSPKDNSVDEGFNTTALLWKANTGGWTQGAQSTPGITRLYHSVALLLPDGSVLSGGGGAPGPLMADGWLQANLNAEIYYPPYLFSSLGAFASRPTIQFSPGSISYGQDPFEVRVNSAIKRVTFIKTGSVTHSFDFEQRFMELSFTTPSIGVLKVQAPSSRVLAPPGNYLLFVFNNEGVPSVAKIVRIG